MNSALLDPAKPASTRPARSAPARMGGIIVIGSTLAGALLFRTHGMEVTPIAWEMVRHFNLFFVVCEIAVVGIAVGAGLDAGGAWSRLRRADKAALLLWLATFWIGSLVSEQPGYSLATVVSWPIHLLFGLSIWHLARLSRKPVEEAVQSISVGVAIVVAGLLVMTALHFTFTPDPALLPGGKVFWAGAIPGFMSVRMFGVVMAYAALLGAGMLFAERERGAGRLHAALLVAGVAAMCWSSTRAALPAFFAALILLPLLAQHRPRQGAWLTVTACVASAAALSLVIPAPDISYGTLAMFGVGDGGVGGGLTAGRIEIWRTVLSAIMERPLIGSGEGATRWLIESGNGVHVQPHNVILQLFLHWGALAACAALWLAGRLGQALTAAVRRERALLPFAMIVTASLVAALFDGALYYPQMVMFPVAALAFALGARFTDGDLAPPAR